jgi:hypothetical protein
VRREPREPAQTAGHALIRVDLTTAALENLSVTGGAAQTLPNDIFVNCAH